MPEAPPLSVLDLFSGIGGFALGLERAGMETVAFCECDPYARRVLRKHWPAAPLFEDVRTLTKRRLTKEGIEPNVICGGFPCQDISTAGKGAGLDGARSGLWREFARLIREVRPRYAILENVAALRSRGLDRVLGDLAAIGYDAEWHCIPAAHVGAPHQRDRVWIIANPHFHGDPILQSHGNSPQAAERPSRRGDTQRFREALAHSAGAGRKAWRPDGMGAITSDAAASPQRGGWPPEPDLPRVADGVPHRVDRLRCLGNAVVPQVVELIGRAVVAHHAIASRRIAAASAPPARETA
jgi:DNA (cytosine-5)-methyltransferase 1